MNPAESFRAAMCKAGLDLAGPIAADRRLHRFKATGDHGRNSWYVLYDGTPAAGAFGCWKRQIQETWNDRDGEKLTASEREAVRLRIQKAETERKRVDKLRRRKARKIAEWILSRSKAADASHAYLVAKRVQPHEELRLWRGKLVVPLRDGGGELHSLQFIGADGSKLFLRGGRIQGCVFTVADTGTGPMVIAEGYATAASIFEATGYATVAAMHCGNLMAVAKALRAKRPERDIILAADNDAWTTNKDGKPFNPGVEAATAAATATHARLAVPTFNDTSTKPTDFNDLAGLEGMNTVKTKITTVTLQTAQLPTATVADYGPALIGDTEHMAINQAYFAARYVADSGVVHDPAVRRFYIYNPVTGLWTHQTDEATVRELGLCFQRIVTEAGYPHFLAKRTSNLLHGLRELARGTSERRDVFNQRRDAIHIANGMLVLAEAGTVELKPFAREWYSRNRSEIAWNPKAECPRFKSELLLSAMSEEDASLIQRYAGQCLLGVNVSQTLLVLRGTPGGGKSTLANVIEGVIGRHNVSELRVAQLCERFELIRFLGRTLLTGKDVPGDFLNMKPAHVLKALVGGDTLEGEVKFGNESFIVEGRFNVLISTNTRLRVKLDSDAGAWHRRMLIVDYARPKPAKPIPGFDSILLREEGEGILRWAVEGAIQLKRELDAAGTIQLTDTQCRRVDDLLSESDSVRSFVRDCIEVAHGGETTIHEITGAYRDYCEARDWEPLRDRQFQAELPDAMLEYHRAIRRNDLRRDGKSVRGFRGVRLKTTSERPSKVSETPEPGNNLPLSDGSDDRRKTSARVPKDPDGLSGEYIKGSEQPSEASELANTEPETVTNDELRF